MKILDWEQFRKLSRVLFTASPEPAQQAARIVAMQRHVVLPSKVGVMLVIYYFLFHSGWLLEAPTTQKVVQEMLQKFFIIYVICTLIGGGFFLWWRRVPPALFPWMGFTMGILDGLLVAGLTMVTGGYDSILFWVFPGLIVLNALSIPLAMPQIVLNLILSVFYIAAVSATPSVWQAQTVITIQPGRSYPASHGTNVVSRTVEVRPSGETLRPGKPVWTDYVGEDTSLSEMSTEQGFLRLSLLWLLTMCCWGTQVLMERQRQAMAEAVEFAAREGQLHSAGRLAAEFAHQIKNPITVINNAAYSLKRSLPNGQGSAASQLEIIQEEVSRVDRVITQIMGYAQLSEGRVEKLNPVQQLEQAIEQVFPAAVPTEIQVKKSFDGAFPPLLMQRGHLREALVNLLQNAQEALGGKGTVVVAAECHPDHSVEISVADNGPGIPPDKMERIFEAYFTTKEKGTGLGLAIVKHNVELYGGTIRVVSGLEKSNMDKSGFKNPDPEKSTLGMGAKFTIIFPAKSLPKPFVK